MREHNIEYLRVICTNACNLNCDGCHKEGQSVHSQFPWTEFYKIISVCIKSGIKKVKFLGGEPTLYEDLSKLIRSLSDNFPNVDLSMISNGTASVEYYERLKKDGLKRLNISVHGWGEQFFLENTRSDKYIWRLIRNHLHCLLSKGYINKINYVIKRGVNENDLYDLIDWLKNVPNIRLDILNFLSLSTSEEDNPYYYSMSAIEGLLRKKYGIIQKSIYRNIYSIDSDNILLSNGLSVNLKSNELKDFNYMNICEKCSQKHLCSEGIAAMRLTTDMKLQPCLIRSDHCLNLKLYNDNYEDAIRGYFSSI